MSASVSASVMKSAPSSQTSFNLSPETQLTLPVVPSIVIVVLVEISAVPSFSCAAAPVSVITGCAAVSVIVVYSGVLLSGSVGTSEISFAQETIASADANNRRKFLVMVFIVIFSLSLITIQMYLHPHKLCNSRWSRHCTVRCWRRSRLLGRLSGLSVQEAGMSQFLVVQRLFG